MKRKVVVKLCSMNGQKSRSKALKIVVGVSGVESATLKEQDQIEVTGEDIDAVAIAMSLRKKVGFADLVAVEEKKEEKKEKTENKEKEPTIPQLAFPAPYYVQEIKYGSDDPACCSIM
ncbi:heavy metal-associated isoprenylated plant protein 16-like [Rhododendron vialii]|uniref:heavy metal-associated isoprenylated plant protein 16-like n=1 Tax=Rhododendron vialii TaxID=182163 RepID=UPI00265EB648|nr:heavy metal-associated isoprenylated plant protein 16-like [Rhododendron vialii]